MSLRLAVHGAVIWAGMGFCCTKAPAADTPAVAEIPAAPRPAASMEPAVAELPQASKESAEQTSKKDAGKKPEESKDAKKPAAVRLETDGFDIIPTAAGGNSTKPSPLASAIRLLREAQLHLKFGAAEQGNIQAFLAAEEILRKAAATLGEPPRVGASDSSQWKAATKALEQLGKEAAAGRQVAATTVAGRFPLIRGFGLDLIDDEDLQVHAYPLPDIARRKAIHDACVRLLKTASADPLHVLVLIPGKNARERDLSHFARLVDAESHLVLGGAPNLTVYPGALRSAVDPMPAWDAPDPAFDPICRRFLQLVDRNKEPHGVMVVMIREFQDETGEQHWVQVQQRTFGSSALDKADGSPDKLEADRVRVAEALARDKSRFSGSILIGIGLLLILAVTLHAAVLHRMSPFLRGWQNRLAIPMAGFLCGVGIAPLIVFALGQTLPPAQTNVWLGSWWPCSAGAMSLILPCSVFRLGMGSIGRYVPSVSCHGRWGISFVPVALGATGAWLWAACYALGWSCIPVVLAAGIAAVLLVYCFGRAIDLADEFPLGLSPIVLVLALLFGAGAFLGSAPVLAIVAGLALLTSHSHSYLVRRQATVLPELGDSANGAATPINAPRTLEELRAALASPLYQPPREFDVLRQALEPAEGKNSVWVGLAGPSAAGKTAAAMHLLRELQSRESRVMVLSGRCSDDAAPYQPFREALADVGVPAAFIAARMEGGGMTNVLDRLADEFIPFWDFFSSSRYDRDDDEENESSRAELFTSVTNALHSLAQDHRIVIFLDDVQWLDEGSAALLKHIRQNFVSPGDAPLNVVLAGRDVESMNRLELTDSTLSVTPPTPAQQVRILVQSLGIQPASARRLVDSLGALSSQSEAMFWLIRAVQELADANAFTTTSRGFALRKRYFSAGHIPVPSAMRARLTESLLASAEHRTVLECAALLGEEFRIDDLVECLEIDRLELLQILRRLEQEQHLLRDLPDDQEGYAFSSAFVLDIVREELGVGSGRIDRAPSKIARELHARIARMLEKRRPRTAELVYRTARHFHRAGTVCAEKSLEHCLAAARLARSRREYRDARRFLSMAEQSARRAGATSGLNLERLLIDAEEARELKEKPTPAAGELVTLLTHKPRGERQRLAQVAELCRQMELETGDARWKSHADQIKRQLALADGRPEENLRAESENAANGRKHSVAGD